MTDNMPDSPVMLTIAQYVETRRTDPTRTEVSERTVRRWLQDGELHGAMQDPRTKGWLIPEDADRTAGPDAGLGVVVAVDRRPAPAVVEPARISSTPAALRMPFLPAMAGPFTVAELAGMWGESEDTIRRWARDGDVGLILKTSAHGAHRVFVRTAGS
jgi:hypothetical protein